MELVDSDLLDRVDPAVRAIAEYALSQPSFRKMDPLELRRMTAQIMRKADTPLTEGIAKTIDIDAEGPTGPIAVRIYVPAGVAPFPVMMYFHGGGWVAGSLDTHDTICRMCCVQSGFIVVSVDYRLAPEAKFPAAPEDCYAATCWTAGNIGAVGGDPSQLVLTGDSAGGNLAAAVALLIADRGGPAIKHQILIYPGLQQTSWSVSGYLSHDNDKSHPYASPLLAKDFNQFPATTLITGECDPLTPQSVAFANRLCSAGIQTHYYCFKGMIHGFFADPTLDAGLASVNVVALMARAAVGAAAR